MAQESKLSFTTDYAKELEGATASTLESGKAYIIYNVGTGKFLNMGGYFGHHAALSTSPMLFYLESPSSTLSDGTTVFIKQDQLNQGEYLGFAPRDNSLDVTVNDKQEFLEGSIGTFVDRTKDDNNEDYCKWTLVSTETEGVYKLAMNLPSDAFDGTMNGDNATFYLCANGSLVLGPQDRDGTNDNHYLYHDYSITSNAAGTDADIIAEASRTSIDFTSAELKVDIDDSNNESLEDWKLIPLNIYKELFDGSKVNLNAPLDVTYLLKDPNFARDSKELSSWNANEDLQSSTAGNENASYKNAKLAFGYDGYYKTSTNDTEYLYGAEDRNYEGNTNYGTSQMIATHASKMCAIIKNGGKGKLYQEVTVNKPGWYYVTCAGSYDGDKIPYVFIACGSKSSSGKLKSPVSANAYLKKIAFYDTYYWPYEEKLPMYNAFICSNREYMTNVYSTPNACIYVSSTDLNDGEATIKIGINTEGEGNGGGANAKPFRPFTADSDGAVTDDTNSNNDFFSSNWVAFGNFKLFYGGNTDDLYLDEKKK